MILNEREESFTFDGDFITPDNVNRKTFAEASVAEIPPMTRS